MAGELELPFEILSAVQAGTRSVLSSLSRLRTHLDAIEASHHDATQMTTAEARPVRTT